MARHEAEREDLLAEARALVDRAEYAVPGLAQPLVGGFRANGAMSLFFGEDPALHWNSQGELRRAYAGGMLYKAEQGRLVALRRERRETETALVRHVFSDDELRQFQDELRVRLLLLRTQFDEGTIQLLRETRITPGELAERIRAILHLVADQLLIARDVRVM
jgi:hypothetical protein